MLTAASMGHANLIKAHIAWADLRAAHLEGASLRGANLKGAYLRDAHLEGVNLRGARGLTMEQIDLAITDKRTQLPDYLKKPPEKEQE